MGLRYTGILLLPSAASAEHWGAEYKPVEEPEHTTRHFNERPLEAWGLYSEEPLQHPGTGEHWRLSPRWSHHKREPRLLSPPQTGGFGSGNWDTYPATSGSTEAVRREVRAMAGEYAGRPDEKLFDFYELDQSEAEALHGAEEDKAEDAQSWTENAALDGQPVEQVEGLADEPLTVSWVDVQYDADQTLDGETGSLPMQRAGTPIPTGVLDFEGPSPQADRRIERRQTVVEGVTTETVSYTHLTLPTKRIV